MIIEQEPPRLPGAGDISRLLDTVREGKAEGAEEWLSCICQQPRALAASKTAHDVSGQTLEPIALVHEAWLRLGPGLSRAPGSSMRSRRARIPRVNISKALVRGTSRK